MIRDRTFERIETLFDIGLFADVNVFVAGCGSGGASVALQLVMSGIRNVTLMDRDTLGPENVIRHICGRSFIGRKKIEAVAEALRDRNPNVRIATIDADIMKYPRLSSEIAKADLVILATDNDPSRYTINQICVQNEVPFVVGRVFTRGIGGEVFAFRPGSACLACLEAKLERTTFREGIREIELVSDEEREKVYGMEIAEIKDSPGLAVDISFITAFHTRFALDAIARQLKERPQYMELMAENYLVWGNRPVHPFNKHFQLQRTEFSQQENCAVCSTRRAANV